MDILGKLGLKRQKEPSESQERRKLQERYNGLVRAHNEKHKQAKVYRERANLNTVDRLDAETHEIHQKLIEVGRQLGKGEDDVAIDLLRERENLEELGLPEFSILAPEDLLDDRDRREKWYPLQERAMGPDELLVVYNTIFYGGGYRQSLDELWVTPSPEAFIRHSRRDALAKRLGDKAWLASYKDCTHFHELWTTIEGVVIKKDFLNELVATISENPKKFRLGKEYYSENELAGARKKFAADVRQVFDKMLSTMRDAQEHAERYQEEKRPLPESLIAQTPELVRKRVGAFVEDMRKKHGEDLGNLAAATAKEWLQGNL